MERHRIHELFPEEILRELDAIRTDVRNTDNNIKASKMLKLLGPLGFTEIGSGTNRLCVRNIDYIYKIAMDSYGIRDNWTEFNMSMELQPYVTKTYECNGLIAVAEYVSIMTKEEFRDSKENIRNILAIITEDYLVCDMGTIGKNYMNFGYTEDGSLVILDYGYIYPLDRKIMHCTKCGSSLQWDRDYSELVCSKCGKTHKPIDIRDRMWKDAENFSNQGEVVKPKKAVPIIIGGKVCGSIG